MPRTQKRASNQKKTGIKTVQQKESIKITDLNPKNVLKNTFIGLSILNTAILILRYCIAISSLESRIINNSHIYICISCLLSIGGWVTSTTTNYWNFKRRKRAYYTVTVISVYLALWQPIYTFLWKRIIPWTMNWKINEAMTKEMVLFASYILLNAAFLVICAFTIIPFRGMLFSEEIYERIAAFKLEKSMDLRPNRKYLYDQVVVWNLETAKPIKFKEQDRFVQTFLDGASGTGKTSSVIITMILGDLNTKFQNMEIRIRKYLKYLQKGKFGIKNTGKGFNEKDIYVKSNTFSWYYTQKLEKIKKKYADCGMTVMAPNNDIIEDVIKGAIARGQRINVMDPVKDWSYLSPLVKMVGINQFYVDPELSEEETAKRIIKNATIFSDVLVAASEVYERIEKYFKDINTSISTNISIVTMLYYHLQGKQATINEIRDAIINFSIAGKYVEYIESALHLYINVPQKSKDMPLQIATAQREENPAMRKNPYYQPLYFIKSELLGEASDDITKQSRGLRLLINSLLQEPGVQRILSADEKTYLDFDKIFSENQITVVNTALENGQVSSTTFGLTFLLQHKAGVLRRPKKERSNHFLYVDEASQYLHSCMEDFYTLYRQYKVAVLLGFQSLAQMSKTAITTYLKNIVLGAGIHILFGRGGKEEMEIYSTMCGLKNQDVVQDTVSRNSILAENATKSFSRRTTRGKVEKYTQQDIRIRDFQEVMVFLSDQGNVLDGQLGKVNFAPKSEFKKKQVHRLNYELYADDPCGDLGKHPEQALIVFQNRQSIEEAFSHLNFGVTNYEQEITDKDTFVFDNKSFKDMIEEQSNSEDDDNFLFMPLEDSFSAKEEKGPASITTEKKTSNDTKDEAKEVQVQKNREKQDTKPKINLQDAFQKMYQEEAKKIQEEHGETGEIELSHPALQDRTISRKDIEAFLTKQTKHDNTTKRSK